VSTHKYRVGQIVAVLPRSADAEEPPGEFVVTEQFHHRGELYYCVKNRGEPYERSLAERRLRAARAGEQRKHLRPLMVGSPALH
jgi:hypothetical protein